MAIPCARYIIHGKFGCVDGSGHPCAEDYESVLGYDDVKGMYRASKQI